MTLAANYSFEAIGTQWSIETASPLSAALKKQLTVVIREFTAAYSRFDQDSLVCRAYRQPNTEVHFPASITTIMDVYQKLHKVSNGAINPLVGGSLEQLGYDSDYSLQAQGPALPAPSLNILDLNHTIIVLKAAALLDIGAIGKGYLIDELATLVAARHQEFVVDGSGDVRVQTRNPQRIGLQDPRDHSRVLGHVNVAVGSLCASATDRRAWGEGLHHILDARTGAPAKTDIIATWAIADSTLIADALTTGLFFASPESLQEAFGPFNYVMLNRDGSARHNIDSIGKLYE